MEADLNTGAKLHFVSRMINQTALSNNAIQESQYAKKGSRAIEAALVKILYFDHIRQNKQPGIFFASDLMQCFDRMQCVPSRTRRSIQERTVRRPLRIDRSTGAPGRG